MLDSTRLRLSKEFPADSKPIGTVKNYFLSKKFELVSETENKVVLKQGSQFITRFFGGYFVPAHNFPKQVQITAISDKVEVIVYETLGFGILDPWFKKKYQNYFEELLNEIK